MKRITLISSLVLLAATAHATLYTYTFTSGFNNGGVIPDANPGGWSDTRSIPNSFTLGPNDTPEIVDVNVRLNISGGYNGDLYGYLVHSSGFAVLLNRSGKTSTDSFGYGNAGFNITLDGQASGHSVTDDVHLYNASGNNPTFSSGKLTGTWQEDGRTDNPLSVTESTANRTALLSSFNTLAANGDWTLFLADMSGGDTSTVVSWGLDIEVVPEPTTWALIGFGALFAGATVVRIVRTKKVTCQH